MYHIMWCMWGRKAVILDNFDSPFMMHSAGIYIHVHKFFGPSQGGWSSLGVYRQFHTPFFVLSADSPSNHLMETILNR